MVRPRQRAVIPQAISGFAGLGVPGRLEMALDDHVAVPNDIRTVVCRFGWIGTVYQSLGELTTVAGYILFAPAMAM